MAFLTSSMPTQRHGGCPRGFQVLLPCPQVGYSAGGKYFVNNHLMFKVLVHRTNGQYTRSRENMAELEAASIIEVRPSALTNTVGGRFGQVEGVGDCLRHRGA